MMEFKDIARELNMSEHQVRRLYKSALSKLAHPKNQQKWNELKEIIRLREKLKGE